VRELLQGTVLETALNGQGARPRTILECVHETPLIFLERLSQETNQKLFLKLESANPTGSMKDRVALYCVQRAEESGKLAPGASIVESTSGSMGISLAMVGAHTNHPVICVIDPKATRSSRMFMQRLGAQVIEVTTADRYGNYLEARLDKVRDLVSKNPEMWWLDQYGNPDHPRAHERHTAAEIARDMQNLIDWIVCPVGTGGLVAGISRFAKSHLPDCKILAVDATGSVALGGIRGPREQIGIGSSVPSKHVCRDLIDETVYISDAEAFRAARLLLEKESQLVGGSTGSTAAGLFKMLPHIRTGSRIVLIAPDHGFKYLDTIYDDNWIHQCPSRHRV
jgi:N-(2-amino-2-carboxyethyl)-L-glutamate synthase